MAIQYNQQYYRRKPDRRILYSSVPITILLGCMYIGIYHGHRYYGFNSVLWLVMIGLFSLIGLESIWFNSKGKWYKLQLLLFIVLFGGPLTAFVIIMHNSYVEHSLAEGSIKVEATVAELFIRSVKGNQTPYAVFTYQVHNKTWKQITINKDNILSVGDKISLICSIKDPEVIKFSAN